MNAKKCDRCGKFYDYAPNKFAAIQRDTFCNIEYDLCEECQNDLKQFMNVQEETDE